MKKFIIILCILIVAGTGYAKFSKQKPSSIAFLDTLISTNTSGTQEVYFRNCPSPVQGYSGLLIARNVNSGRMVIVGRPSETGLKDIQSSLHWNSDTLFSYRDEGLSKDVNVVVRFPPDFDDTISNEEKMGGYVAKVTTDQYVLLKNEKSVEEHLIDLTNFEDKVTRDILGYEVPTIETLCSTGAGQNVVMFGGLIDNETRAKILILAVNPSSLTPRIHIFSSDLDGNGIRYLGPQ